MIYHLLFICRIRVGVVVAKMEEILKDHEDLILRFNKFLPKGYEMLLLPKGEIQFEDAVKYVNKIKVTKLLNFWHLIQYGTLD